MGMFGGFSAKNGSIAGLTPAEPSFADKLGLIGDILTGNPVTKKRLDDDFAFQQAQYQSLHPAPVKVSEGETFIDPLTGKTVFSGPPKVPAIGQNVAYLNSLKPGLGDAYAQNFSNNGGGQGPGLITVNGQQMMRAPGASPAPAPIHPEAIARLRQHPEEASMFDQTFGAGSAAKVLGGAAPTASAPFLK